MEKLYLPERPAHSNKLRLLIDECIESGNYGLTTDRAKVEYNLKMLGMHEHVLRQSAASAQGMSFVFDAGRFIVIAKVKSDQSQMSMDFFDFRVYANFREVNASKLDHEFSEKVVSQFEKILYQLNASYRDAADNKVELILED